MHVQMFAAHVLFATLSIPNDSKPLKCVYLQFHVNEPKARNVVTDIMESNNNVEIKERKRKKKKWKEKNNRKRASENTEKDEKSLYREMDKVEMNVEIFRLSILHFHRRKKWRERESEKKVQHLNCSLSLSQVKATHIHTRLFLYSL